MLVTPPLGVGRALISSEKPNAPCRVRHEPLEVHWRNLKALDRPSSRENYEFETDRWTALMGAAEEGDSEAVKLLLNAGADKSLKSTDGDDAVDLAELSGAIDVLQILKDAG